MRGVNKVILICTLGKDPEAKYFPSGDAVCNVSAATNESWTDKQSGEKKEHTEWHNLVFRKKLAEIVVQYLKKGSKIYVEGAIKTRKYAAKDGGERYITEILVRDMQMLDGRSQGGDTSRPAATGAPERAPAGAEEPFEDDDIPF